MVIMKQLLEKKAFSQAFIYYRSWWGIAVGFLFFILFSARPALAQTEEYFQNKLDTAKIVLELSSELSPSPKLGPAPAYVGTFNAATGSFSWHCSLISSYVFLDKPGIKQGPTCMVLPIPPSGITNRIRSITSGGSGTSIPRDYLTLHHIAQVDAYLVNLIIGLKNNTQGVMVNMPDHDIATIVPQGQPQFQMIAPFAGSVAFSLNSGGKTFSIPQVRTIKKPDDPELYFTQTEFFSINSPQIRLGAGAFIVPALPIAIIYQPPWNEPQTLTEETMHAVTVKSHLSQTTDLLMKYEVHPLEFLLKVLAIAAGAATASEGNAAMAKDAETIKKIIGFLEPIKGATLYKEKVQNILSATAEHTVDVSLKFGITYPTTPTLGPGHGDTFVYLRDVLYVWGGHNDRLVLSPVAYRKVVVTSVANLRDNPLGSPPSPTPLDEMLVLDPQSDPDAPVVLDPGRFFLVATIENELEVPIPDFNARYEFKESHLLAEVSSSTTFKEQEANFIAQFFGVEEEAITKSTTTYGTSQQLSKSAAREAHFTIPPKTQAEIYYDVLFGSFLIRKVDSTPEPPLSGVWEDLSGRPVAYALIRLEVNGVPITTITDANGRFAFHSRRIRPGVFILKTGDKATMVQLGPQPMRNLFVKATPKRSELRLPKRR